MTNNDANIAQNTIIDDTIINNITNDYIKIDNMVKHNDVHNHTVVTNTKTLTNINNVPDVPDNNQVISKNYVIRTDNDIDNDIDNIEFLLKLILKNIYKYDKNKLNINIIIINVIEVVELSNYKGNHKKQMSLWLVQKLINVLQVKNTNNMLFIKLQENLDNGFISDTIDLIIAASKNEIQINNVTDIIKSNYFKTIMLKLFKNCIKK
jgi:hypothetical protein